MLQYGTEKRPNNCSAAFFVEGSETVKQTSFSPNFNNKTTAVAGQSPQNKTSFCDMRHAKRRGKACLAPTHIRSCRVCCRCVCQQQCILGVPHPIGMHRSVEDTVSVQNVHPIGDASPQDAIFLVFPVSTERHIPNGM
jgi:hypothetical protein